MKNDFLVVCAMIGTGRRHTEPFFVNQTLGWLDWHAGVANRIVLYMDGLSASIGEELSHRSLVPVETVYDAAPFEDAKLAYDKKRIRQSLVLAKCLRRLRGRATWVAFFDSDEFVTPPGTFRATLHTLPAEVDWVFLRWRQPCAKRPFPRVYKHSGKSVVKPEFFRDDTFHLKQSFATNGILSSKSNSLHKFVPLPGLYNATSRMVVVSKSPHPARCESAEIGSWPCRVVRTHDLVHRRIKTYYPHNGPSFC